MNETTFTEPTRMLSFASGGGASRNRRMCSGRTETVTVAPAGSVAGIVHRIGPWPTVSTTPRTPPPGSTTRPSRKFASPTNSATKRFVGRL